MKHGEFCSFYFDGLGTECRRCRCWQRGTEPPECPPFITRCEPDNKRLPHLTPLDNDKAWTEYVNDRDRQLRGR